MDDSKVKQLIKGKKSFQSNTNTNHRYKKSAALPTE